MKIYIVLLMLGLLLFSPLVSSFFPPQSHDFIIDRALDKPQTTEVYNACKNNRALCYAGNTLADISVYWYYQKFIRYKVTHTPTLCRDLLDSANGEEELACASGGCTHQSGDFVSHAFLTNGEDGLVPTAIRKTLFPNAIIHPFAEEKVDIYVDSITNTNYRELVKREDYEKCQPLFERVLVGNENFQGVELKNRFALFIDEVTGVGKTGYDMSFNRILTIPFPVLSVYFGFLFFLIVYSSLLFFLRIRHRDKRTFLNWFTFIFMFGFIILMIYFLIALSSGNVYDTFISVIAKPGSKLVLVEPSIYIEDAIKRTESFFATGESALFGTDASGEVPLAVADKKIKTFQYIAFFIIGGLSTWILFKNFKRKKQSGGFNL